MVPSMQAHKLNGNRSHYKILQINGSNADFNTKLIELKDTINENQSEVILISESNADVSNDLKMLQRSKEFPDYKFEDKLVDGNKFARNTVMIHKNLQHKRLPQFEDNLNSTTVIKFKDGKSKWVYLVSIYRQWKLKGDFNAFDNEGIKKQIARLKTQCINLHKIRKETDNMIVGGDISIDKNLHNDPTNRPELKALTPIWDQCMLDCGLIQLNFKNTWHMPGKRPSLLDLYYTTKPQMISGVENVTNMLSEHDGVKLNLHTKNLRVRPQFDVVRNYKNVNYQNLMEELDENRNTKI